MLWSLIEMLHVIYRSYGGENDKPRPEYYSKLLALMSFIRSFQQLRTGVAEIIFLNDGPIAPDLLHVMEQCGAVMTLSGSGLRSSWHTALELPAARGWSNDDLVWFAEDDYLYLPHALNDLVAAAEIYPQAAYFGLYAMVGSRLPNGDRSEDRVPRKSRWPDPEARLVHGHPWRGAISTTSTFGARVKPLLEDQSMMQLASRSGGAWDHTICLMYEGFMPYTMKSLIATLQDPKATKSLVHRAAICAARMGLDLYQAARSIRRPGRLLIASDPALITHLETAFLALGTDWRSVAIETQQWMQAQPFGSARSKAAYPANAAAE